MEIGIIAKGYIPRYEFESACEKMKAHGYSCIDYSSFTNTETDFFNLPEKDFEKEVTRQRSIIEGNGLRVNQTHAPWRFPPLDATPEQRAIRIEQMAKAVRGSAYIGADNFVIHPLMPFGIAEYINAKEVFEINEEFLLKLGEVAKEYGVKSIDLENLPFPNFPINNPADILEFVKKLNAESSSDIFKICIDTGHANYCRQNPADAVRLVGKHLGSLHVHDNYGMGDDHNVPYDGTIDWQDFSKALKEVNYSGVFSFETWVSDDIPIGEERERLEIKLYNDGVKIASGLDMQ